MIQLSREPEWARRARSLTIAAAATAFAPSSSSVVYLMHTATVYIAVRPTIDGRSPALRSAAIHAMTMVMIVACLAMFILPSVAGRAFAAGPGRPSGFPATAMPGSMTMPGSPGLHFTFFSDLVHKMKNNALRVMADAPDSLAMPGNHTIAYLAGEAASGLSPIPESKVSGIRHDTSGGSQRQNALSNASTEMRSPMLRISQPQAERRNNG